MTLAPNLMRGRSRPSYSRSPRPRPLSAQLVTTANLENAATDNTSWLSYGRDYYAQRFVRSEEITPQNVGRLRPAWVFATGGDNRGLHATPLIHNGVIYLSADQSRVFAIDARTGQKKWAYVGRQDVRWLSDSSPQAVSIRGVMPRTFNESWRQTGSGCSPSPSIHASCLESIADQKT